jgi:mRNA-degrading endonuclease RelE of RelBE toxin-antitoxin system
MELKYKGTFKRDFETANRALIVAVYQAVMNVKAAKSIEQIHHLKKLHKYKTHYRIRIANDYRIGIIIRKNTVWFVRFGHRNIIYKQFP